MMKIIKWELSYYKIAEIIGAVYLLFFSLVIGLAGDIQKTEITYTLVAMSVYAFIIARWGHFIIYKDNLERVYAQLPMTKKSVSLARILGGLAVWLFNLSILLLIIYIFRKDISPSFSIWSILSINGLVMILNVSPLIWHDLIFTVRSKHSKVIAYFIYVPFIAAIFITVFLTTTTLLESDSELQSSAQKIIFNFDTAALINLFGLILSFISYKLYLIRNSYLKSEFGLSSNIRVKHGDIN